MRGLVEDAERRLLDRKVRAQQALIIGLSVGSYPATYLANRIGARLCSVASADRADLAVWQSPATRIIKNRAVQKGIRLSDYSHALFGTHPAQNLAAIAKNSVFVMGQRDPFVPPARGAGLLQAIEMHTPHAEVVNLNAGHLRTLMVSGRHQQAMLGIAVASRWRLGRSAMSKARELCRPRIAARIPSSPRATPPLARPVAQGDLSGGGTVAPASVPSAATPA